MFFIRRAIIRFVTPLAWRLSKERQCRALLDFASIEKDSAAQLIDAMKFVDDPKAKAEIFQHVLEEYHHADLFEEASERLSKAPMVAPVLERDRLVSAEKADFDKLGFLTYVYVGEKNVNRDFSTYAKVSPDAHVVQVFKKVQADEQGHEDHAFNMLQKLAGQSELVLRWNLIKAGARLRYRTYVSAVQGFGEIFLTAWLAIVYFGLGWVVAPSCRERIKLDDDEQFKIFARSQDHVKL